MLDLHHCSYGYERTDSLELDCHSREGRIGISVLWLASCLSVVCQPTAAPWKLTLMMSWTSPPMAEVPTLRSAAKRPGRHGQSLAKVGTLIVMTPGGGLTTLTAYSCTTFSHSLISSLSALTICSACCHCLGHLCIHFDF